MRSSGRSLTRTSSPRCTRTWASTSTMSASSTPTAARSTPSNQPRKLSANWYKRGEFNHRVTQNTEKIQEREDLNLREKIQEREEFRTKMHWMWQSGIGPSCIISVSFLSVSSVTLWFKSLLSPTRLGAVWYRTVLHNFCFFSLCVLCDSVVQIPALTPPSRAF